MRKILGGMGLSISDFLAPGSDTGDAMLSHDISESGIVVFGEIEVTAGPETRVLRAGDAFLF
ncbi:MAG: hypothetical protein ABJJ37_19510 [Roseibium sp.]